MAIGAGLMVYDCRRRDERDHSGVGDCLLKGLGKGKARMLGLRLLRA